MYTFYRGDTRLPAAIRQANGFNAWIQLSTSQAQLLIKKAQGQAVKDSEFPIKLVGALNGVEIKRALDLQTFIKYTKNKTTTPQVSTAYDEDCGGQANGKDANGNRFVIYKIEYSNLYILDKQALREPNDKDFPHASPFPNVVINAATLDNADVIAIKMKDELAFLTSIPLDKIKQYKQYGGNWTDF